MFSFSLCPYNSLTIFPALLLNDGEQLATLALSTAGVCVEILGNVLRVNGSLGSLTLTDDSALETTSPTFKKILTIEGDNLANFGYQTFDPNDKATFRGVNSLVTLKSGALRLTFLEEPLHGIYLFLIKLGKLKGLYDAAAAVAAQRAAEIQRMQFEVSIKSPILVFPRDPTKSNDALVMMLGQISANNSYEGKITTTKASLSGIKLTSTKIQTDGQPSQKQDVIIEDVQINADVLQTSDIDRTTDLQLPDTQVRRIGLKSCAETY